MGNRLPVSVVAQTDFQERISDVTREMAVLISQDLRYDYNKISLEI